MIYSSVLYRVELGSSTSSPMPLFSSDKTSVWCACHAAQPVVVKHSSFHTTSCMVFKTSFASLYNYSSSRCHMAKYAHVIVMNNYMSHALYSPVIIYLAGPMHLHGSCEVRNVYNLCYTNQVLYGENACIFQSFILTIIYRAVLSWRHTELQEDQDTILTS